MRCGSYFLDGYRGVVMFTTRWYKTWPGCRRVIRGIRGDLHETINAHLPDRFCRDQQYCVVFYNKKPCGVLKSGIHSEPGIVLPSAYPDGIPFICEAATTCEYRGAGEALFLAFLNKCGTPFWLKCMDDAARQFWEHMGRKHKIPFREIGHTSWGTGVLGFGFHRQGKSSV